MHDETGRLMVAQTLKAMTQTRSPKIGTMLVEFDTPGIGQIMKAAGCEFVFVDMEHSGFGYESLKRTLRYTQAAELPTLVRVPPNRYDHIARGLDIGAEGIMIPMVGSAEECRHILDCMKYPPQGNRGVALQVAHDRYAPGPVMRKLRAANRATTFFALIETAEGVENADAIAAIKGVDCLWIGHFDLTCSLGIPGEFGDPRFKKAVQKVIDAAKKHDKSLARMVPDVATGLALNKQGFDFIAYSGDIWVYQAALQAGVEELWRKCQTRRARSA